MNLRVTLTGGASGGHLYPGLAIVEELSRREPCEVQFIGTRQGLESRVIPELGYQFNIIWMAGIHRGRIFVNMLFLHADYLYIELVIICVYSDCYIPSLYMYSTYISY